MFYNEKFKESNSTFILDSGEVINAFENEDGKRISLNGKDWDCLIPSQQWILENQPIVEPTVAPKTELEILKENSLSLSEIVVDLLMWKMETEV